MRLALVRHLWGVDLSRGFAPHLASWRETGYEALEASPLLVPDAKVLFGVLRETKLGWIPQVFSHLFHGGGTVGDHLDSLREQIEACLDHDPLFFNAHSGSDSWSLTQAEDFYSTVAEWEKTWGKVISHETHRSRFFGNPWHTQAILESFPDLRLTCDFSHWVCVAERLLPDCGEIIALAARHAHHLHARVGHEQGPQVADPRAPEWNRHLAIHESWWNEIWTAQQTRGQAISTLTPEFGPPPYMPVLPYVQKPLAELDSICDWMASRQMTRFKSFASPQSSI